MRKNGVLMLIIIAFGTGCDGVSNLLNTPNCLLAPPAACQQRN